MVKTKQELAELRPTTAETLTLNGFIVICVRGDYFFTILTDKAGVSPRMDVQELYKQSPSTLIIYGKILAKECAKHVTTTFDPLNEGVKPYTAPGYNNIKGTDMLDILTIMIKEKTYAIESAKRMEHLETLRAEFEDLKTTKEKRADLMKEIALAEAGQ